jgi:cell division protein FtsB
MEEKKLATILEALADKIDNLELGVYIQKTSYEQLKEESERLKKENDSLRKDNVLLTRELRGEVVFKKVEVEDLRND